MKFHHELVENLEHPRLLLYYIFEETFSKDCLVSKAASLNYAKWHKST